MWQQITLWHHWKGVRINQPPSGLWHSINVSGYLCVSWAANARVCRWENMITIRRAAATGGGLGTREVALTSAWITGWITEMVGKQKEEVEVCWRRRGIITLMWPFHQKALFCPHKPKCHRLNPALIRAWSEWRRQEAERTDAISCVQ